MKTQIHTDVRDYYGTVLKTQDDLKTTACCAAQKAPPQFAALIKRIPEAIRTKFYGCGTPFPSCLEGLTIIDLGSGAGRDCYVLSQLVGENGRVIGIDMTENQLLIAREHLNDFSNSLGYRAPNMEFREGFIEDLKTAELADKSVDIIISNCVINLSPAKDMVFSEAFRVLKPGGEFYFSDVFADRRLPKDVQNDPVLIGECLGGALYKEDFRRLMAQSGFTDFRIVSRQPIEVTHQELKEKLGQTKFESMTVRAFKIPLEDAYEDYGQTARYLGTDPDFPNAFMLDEQHIFEKGRWIPVCRNTALMLGQSRLKQHFEIQGDTSIHYGLFGRQNSRPPVARASTTSCC